VRTWYQQLSDDDQFHYDVSKALQRVIIAFSERSFLHIYLDHCILLVILTLLVLIGKHLTVFYYICFSHHLHHICSTAYGAVEIFVRYEIGQMLCLKLTGRLHSMKLKESRIGRILVQ